jgi:hypothetical protein
MGGSDERRTNSIRVNIFELAKTEFVSVAYACFLAFATCPRSGFAVYAMEFL